MTKSPGRHRLRRILLWVAGVLVLLPVGLVCAVLALANTNPGRRLIEREAGSLSGGMVALRGLSGRFPDALRLAHLDVRDARGTWLTLDDVALDWSPLALAGRTARITRLQAAGLDVLRLPAPAAKPAPPSKGGFSLPVQVDLQALDVARLTLGATVAGHAAILHLSGSAQVASLADARARLAIDRLDGPGTYRLDGRLDAASINATLDAAEPSGGLVSGLAALPALGALSLHASIAGPRSAERTAVTLAAGQLHANVNGTVDLAGGRAALDVDANAPAMAPRPDLSWDSVALQAHIHGPFTTPEVAARAELHGVHGGGASIAALTLDAGGNRGAVDAHAVLAGLVPERVDRRTAFPLSAFAAAVASMLRLQEMRNRTRVHFFSEALTADTFASFLRPAADDGAEGETADLSAVTSFRLGEDSRDFPSDTFHDFDLMARMDVLLGGRSSLLALVTAVADRELIFIADPSYVKFQDAGTGLYSGMLDLADLDLDRLASRLRQSRAYARVTQHRSL